MQRNLAGNIARDIADRLTDRLTAILTLILTGNGADWPENRDSDISMISAMLAAMLGLGLAAMLGTRGTKLFHNSRSRLLRFTKSYAFIASRLSHCAVCPDKLIGTNPNPRGFPR